MFYIRRTKRKIEEIVTKRFSLSWKGLAKFVVLVLLIAAIIPATLNSLIITEYQDEIYLDSEELEPERVAIVFGAGLQNDGSAPSSVLEDRILTAVDLYKDGKVQKIIMSGDNRFVDYNEPQVMVDFAIDNGVRDFDVQPDFAGRSTYETCYRAKEIFGLNEAILITQEYHLPRALYICNTLGIDSVGMAADRRLYQHIGNYKFREVLATVLAFWNLYIGEPEVVLGEKIVI